MHSARGLGIYWRTLDVAQIGLDPDRSVRLPRLVSREHAALQFLTGIVNEQDVRTWAEQHGIDGPRMVSLWRHIGESAVGVKDEPWPDVMREQDCAARERAGLGIPHQRTAATIGIDGVTEPSWHAALALSDAGIGNLALVRDYEKRSKHVSALSRKLPRTSMHTDLVTGTPPTVVLLTSSRVSRTRAAQRYAAADIPVLEIVCGETCVAVGPLVVPGVTACLNCSVEEFRERDSGYDILAAQAAEHPPIECESTSARFAGVAAARDLLTFVESRESMFLNRQMLIRPGCEWPEWRTIVRHPSCSCQDYPDYLAERAIHPSTTDTMAAP